MKPPSTLNAHEQNGQFGQSLFGFLLLCLLLVVAFPALSASPLVSAQWLHENFDNKSVRVIDLQPVEGYRKVHLKGSVNSQYSDWRQRKPVAGKALPNIEYLESLLGHMGISEDTHVVLAPLGVNANEIAVATRIYWTLKVLGHKDISILDGGLIAYSQIPQAHFSNEKVLLPPARYQAKPDLELAPSAKDVLSALNEGTLFIDYRSQPEFLGLAGGAKPGTIPGSKNLPFDLLVQPTQGGRFLKKQQILDLYKAQNIDPNVPAVGFCNSGHRASLAWFVQSELLGNKEARLYDGSMAEWVQYPDNPVVKPKP